MSPVAVAWASLGAWLAPGDEGEDGEEAGGDCVVALVELLLLPQPAIGQMATTATAMPAIKCLRSTLFSLRLVGTGRKGLRDADESGMRAVGPAGLGTGIARQHDPDVGAAAGEVRRVRFSLMRAGDR